MNYGEIKNFDIANLSSKSSVNLINDNLAISNNFEKNEKHVHSSGLKKILVSQLAVFSGSGEQKLEIINEEETTKIAGTEEKIEDSTSETENQAISESTEPVIQPVVNQTIQTSVIESHNKNDVYEKDGIILRHSFDEIYNTKFYNDNSCAYCEFLSIVCGNELV